MCRDRAAGSGSCEPDRRWRRGWWGAFAERPARVGRAGLGGGGGGGAAKGEAVFGDGDVEEVGELVAVFDAADGARDLVLARGAGAAGDLIGQLGQRRFGGLQ